jgi:CubicO group peptidase (beta-lactamase class C family)
MTSKRRSRLLAVLFATLAPAAACAHGADEAARIARVEQDLLPSVRVRGRSYTPATIEARMRHYGVPAVSVAVIHEGRIAWARAYGMADVESERAATPATLFQAASMSKPVAATAALLLVQDGRLELDQDVNAKLTSWKVPASDLTATEPVTLRRLLTHTAGLTVHGFPGYAAGEPVPTTVQVLDGATPANTAAVRVDLVPGSQWRYSGGGMTVMQLLMADVTGTPFPELMRRRVLEPMGMRASTYQQPLPASLATRAATGYGSDGTPLEGRYHTHPEMAAAGLWTTPAELARWIMGVQRSATGGRDPLLRPETAEAMLTPGLGGWGLGMGVRGAGDSLVIRHSGANAGFRGQFVGYVRRGEGAVVMANSDEGAVLVSEIMAAIAREYGWPDAAAQEIAAVAITPDALGEYAGRYTLPNTPIELSVSRENGMLFFAMEGGQKAELVPTGRDEFRDAVGNNEVSFERGRDGRVAAMVVSGQRLPRTP